MSAQPSAVSATERRSAQSGSAYLFVLLILLVLTIVGLALAVITQTEVQIGSAEKSATRVLYGADSGVRLQLAFTQTRREAPKGRYILDENDIAGATMRERLDVAPMLPMYLGPCALCSVNWQSEQRYWAVNSVTNAESRRLGIAGTDQIPQATRLVTMMFFVQPQPEPNLDEGLRQFDPEDTADDSSLPGLDVIRY
jgi:hypothetical protein